MDIAIIGMAGRFPDAENINELYENLKIGRDSVREISPERIRSTTLAPNGTYYTCGYIADIDKFDYKLFNISLGEAQTMGPVQRQLLEVVYNIIESSGYSIDYFNGTNTAVFVGASPSDYYKHADSFATTLISGNMDSYLPSVIARQFNFTGNAQLINTACSSSLVAVHNACNELALGNAEYALACGANIYVFPYSTIPFAKDDKTNLESPDGRSKAFSAEANGMSHGEAVAGILLKPLEKAIKDKDIIYAVIKSTVVNNNAKRSESLKAVDSITLSELLKLAWTKAGVKPEEIGYIEAHGSGTKLGDALEIEGLDIAFRSYTEGKNICPISTIKSNIGHTRMAAGISGLIRAILSLKNKVLFPTANFESPSPLINFKESAVYVNKAFKYWAAKDGLQRYAGVTSLGESGINCHVVLSEAPDIKDNNASKSHDLHLITVSSNTYEGLIRNLNELNNKISQMEKSDLGNISYTLNTGRKHYDYRFAAIVKDFYELSNQINKRIQLNNDNIIIPKKLKKLVFMFSDHKKISDNILNYYIANYDVFKEEFEHCMKLSLNINDNTRNFAFQYSLYRLLDTYGISTNKILGTGIGRIIYATISGELTLKEGLERAFNYRAEEIKDIGGRVESFVKREAEDGAAAFIVLGSKNAISEKIEEYIIGNRNLHIFYLQDEAQNTDPILMLFKLLYLAMYDINWYEFHKRREGNKIELTLYQYDKTRCWLRETPKKVTSLLNTINPKNLKGENITEIENMISKYWWDALEIEELSVEDNFFEIGGDSLKATQVINAIIKDMHISLSFEDLFDFPSIRLLSGYINSLLGVEQKLAIFWKQVLKVEKVNTNDSFFELGGHSLLASQVLIKIKKEFCIELNFEHIFRYPTLKELSAYISEQLNNEGCKIEYKDIELANEGEYYPLSSAQKRMFLLNQLDKTSISYNNFVALTIEGVLCKDKLEKAFNRLIERHEALRTSFKLVNGKPMQKICKDLELYIEYIDSKEEDVQKVLGRFVRPFDLNEAPLLRVAIIRLEEEKQILAFDIHHIISDGTSMGILIKEISALYNNQNLSELRIQYKDYAVWQNKLLGSKRLASQKKYWLEEFSGELVPLNLPTDYERPIVQSFEGDSIDIEINEDIANKLRQLTNKTGATMYMVLLSVFNILLSKYCGQEDIIIGSPIAGRPHTDLENIIGMFVNTLAMRNSPEGNKRYIEFLRDVKYKAIEAYENQDYQFEELVENIKVKRDMGRNPIFDVVFTMQNMDMGEACIDGLKLHYYKPESKVSKFDLTLNAMEVGGAIRLSMEYCIKLFSRKTIENMLKHFLNIINEIIKNPEIKLKDIDMLSNEEKNQLLNMFSAAYAKYPKEKAIHKLFEEQAERTPDSIAAVYNDKQLTYRELNDKSNKIARILREEGIVPDAIVGIMTERSLEMIIGIIGILKAGGAYLPIIPEYPKERIEYMLTDSGCKLLVTQKHLKETIEFDGKSIIVDCENIVGEVSNLEHINKPNDLAYIIYTSGTSGKPKGAMINHKNVVRLMFNDKMRFDFGSKDVWTLFHSFCFDFSVWEMYGALLYGGKLIVVPKTATKDPNEYIKLLYREGVTVLNQTPSIFYRLVDEESQQKEQLQLRYVIFGGEALQPAKLKSFHERYSNTKLINMYGITETTVHVTYKEITDEEISSNISNIGKPIPTLTTYVMDKNMKLLPIGVPGELCVGGDGVGKGYLNRPGLTAERFAANPYKENERLYKSGDLVRILPSGDMEYLGRIDHQVKIRGYRVELGEIENKLLSHEAIKETVVIARDDNKGNNYICAFVVGERELTVLELREHLSKTLPDYMIPSNFIQLDKLPLTSNGKVDRKALLEQDYNISTGMEYEAPRSSIEEQLIAIWEEVLGVENIGINNNFFELGGHSLKAISLGARIHKVLNVEIPIKEIFKAPTIKGISEYINNSEESIYSIIEPVAEKDYYEMSSAQKRMYIINQMYKESTGYNITRALIIEGELSLQKLTEVFAALIDRHEALRTSFELIEEGFVQKIHKRVSFEVEYSEVENEVQASQKLKSFVKAFDLSKAPLLRVGLVKVQSNKYILIYDMHHIISDGVSMEILIKEFCMLYQGISLPKLRIQYKDYTEWFKKSYFTKRLEKQEKYWIETFKNEITTLNMPLDYDSRNWQAFAGDTIQFKINNDIVKRLQELAIQENTTLNTLLLSLYNILLSKYCGQQDIIVGSTVSNRNYAELENMVGIFINFLPIRSSINPNMKVLEYIQAYKTLLQEVYDNQDYPFDEIVENCMRAISNSRNPIFDTMLIFHNEIDVVKNAGVDNLQISPYKLNRKSAALDFKLDIGLNSNNEFECYIEYNNSLYKASSMLALAKHYELLMAKTLDNLESNIIDIEIFNEEEKLNIEEKRKLNNINKASNIVISSTFTADPLEEHLSFWCEKFGETVKVSFAPYNQVFQELINQESISSKNNGINLIMVRFEDWIRDINCSDKEKCSLIEENYGKLIDILKNKEKNSKYMLGVFPIAAHLGLSVEVTDYIKELGNEYKAAIKNMNDVSLLDFNDIAELYNIGEVFSPMSDKAGHMPFTDEYYAAIGTAIARKIHAIKHNPFKVIAVDCDNTLWKGVVGEDGALGVTIEEPHIEIQKLLIQKYNEGMLIALSSKNNEADVWEVFDKNPQMLLTREHIIAWKINWESKYTGIRDLAQELNLGIDSFIFIDDNAKECYEMMANNPQVLTLQLPEDSRQIPRFLKHVWAFDNEKVTKEDKSRTKLYQVERQRQEAQKESTALEDFLKNLNLKVYINEIEEEEVPRVSQLTQRTNQFNLSTIRRTEADIEGIMKNSEMKIWTIQVEDRFGEYGLTGVLIMKVKKETAFLDTFLLSCRVLGRNVETVILAEIGKYCKEKGISNIEADFYPTKKNKPFEEFLEVYKWQFVCESEKCMRYEIQVSNIDYKIDYIECYFCKEKLKSQDKAISEAAVILEAPAQADNKKYITVEPNWQINIHNEEALLHKNYLLQLRYYTGKKLLDIPRTEQKYRNNNQAYEAPRNIIEEKLATIYRDILKIERIGINDNFFELGGNSIKLISLVLKLNKEFGVDIYPQKVFEMPTIKGISERIFMGQFVKQLYLLNEEKEKKIFAFPPIGGYGISYTGLARLIETHSLYVFDFIDSEHRIEQYVKQIMEVQKEGPYVILGYSAGGNLAYEVAFQMIKDGYEVSDILIIDTDLENEAFKNMKEEQIDIMKIVEKGIENMAARKTYEEVNQTLDVEHFRATVERSINIFISYLKNFNIKEDKLKSNIHLLLSEALTEENREHIIKTWECVTAGRLIIYNGTGRHGNMIVGGDLKHNADLLNEILRTL